MSKKVQAVEILQATINQPLSAAYALIAGPTLVFASWRWSIWQWRSLLTAGVLGVDRPTYAGADIDSAVLWGGVLVGGRCV